MQKIKLQVIFKVVIALLILVFALAIFTGGKANNNVVKTSKELVGQGNSTLRYGSEIYFIDKYSNSIIAYNNKTKDSFVIAKTSKNIKNKMYVINNNLIFATDDATYYISLLGEPYTIQKLMDGEVSYINDDVMVYIDRSDTLNKLYIGSYDKASFRATTTIYYELARGYNIDFIKRIDDKLYFNSSNSDRSTSLFAVDLKANEVSFVAKQKFPQDANVISSKIVDVEVDKDLFYYVQVVTSKDSLDATINTATLWKADSSQGYDKVEAEDTLPIIYKAPKSYGGIFYEVKKQEGGKYVWNDSAAVGKFNWLTFVYGDVTRFLKIVDGKITLSGIEDLAIDIEDNLKLKYAIHFENKLYMLLTNEDVSAWYEVKQDGTDLNKIFEY